MFEMIRSGDVWVIGNEVSEENFFPEMEMETEISVEINYIKLVNPMNWINLTWWFNLINYLIESSFQKKTKYLKEMC